MDLAPTREATAVIRIRGRRVSLREACLLSRGRQTITTVVGPTVSHRSWAGPAVRMEEAVAAVVGCSLVVGPDDAASSREEGPVDDRMEAEEAPAVTDSISRIIPSAHTTMWL